jgi:Polyketide cyclase / dehydrase and lipid transport
MTTLHAHELPHKHCSISAHRPRRYTALLWVAVQFMLNGCASIKETQPKGDAMKIYEVAVTRKAVIAGNPDAVFKFITAEDVLPKVLTGYGLLPAVLRTSGNTGPWDRPGSARVVHLADGSTVREQLTGYDSPKRFTYRVWEFGNPIVRALATQATGEWDFVATAEGTQVTWTYTFQAKNAATALSLSGIAQILWRGYMDVCLENTQKIMLAQSSK